MTVGSYAYVPSFSLLQAAAASRASSPLQYEWKLRRGCDMVRFGKYCTVQPLVFVLVPGTRYHQVPGARYGTRYLLVQYNMFVRCGFKKIL
jgi:hypothetical protein